MKRIFIFTFLCLLYSCNVLNLDGSKPIIEIKDGAFDPNTGLDAWGYDPLSATHVSAWNMPATDLILTLPITDSPSHYYDFTIDWGDGTVESIGSSAATGENIRGSGYDGGTEPPEISHTYATAGIYTIEITGTFEEWSFMDVSTSTSNDNVNLIRVHSFGDLGYKWLSNAFRDCTNLTHFAGGYTQNVTSMNNMFSGASGLTSLDLSSFDTSIVTIMLSMFSNTSGLTSLDLSSFDTSSVIYMSFMFNGASGLTSLDLSSFNTSNVTNMISMFSGASGLTSLDLSSFDTSNVTHMNNMFSGASGLTFLDLSSFNTSIVTSMQGMFSGASGLTSLDLSSFNTSNVTYMNNMFSGASGLTSLDLSSFNTSIVTTMNTMFSGASGLTTLDLSNFNTSNVTDMKYMFSGASGLTSLDLTNWDTSSLTATDYTDWLFGTTNLNKDTGITCTDPDGTGSNTVNGEACN